MARINKKTNQRVITSIGKMEIGFHLYHSCILISMLILSSLTRIDARIKVIYIDSSHKILKNVS